MYDPTPEAAALRRQAATDAAQALQRLARINVEHSSGPDAAAEFTQRMSTRGSRLSFDVTFSAEGVTLIGIEHKSQGSTGVVGLTLEAPQ
ncbi:MAG: hypothetical protein Q7U73_04990 [Rubrivivax sp.]|nr:hypothetical protein [Rubrivivax sp.]